MMTTIQSLQPCSQIIQITPIIEIENFFNLLPNEILELIFIKFNFTELLKNQRVCKKFYYFIQSYNFMNRLNRFHSIISIDSENKDDLYDQIYKQ